MTPAQPSYPDKSTITIDCDAGYELIGQRSMTCDQDHGGWDSIYPTCRKYIVISCAYSYVVSRNLEGCLISVIELYYVEVYVNRIYGLGKTLCRSFENEINLKINFKPDFLNLALVLV